MGLVGKLCLAQTISVHGYLFVQGLQQRKRKTRSCCLFQSRPSSGHYWLVIYNLYEYSSPFFVVMCGILVFKKKPNAKFPLQAIVCSTSEIDNPILSV